MSEGGATVLDAAALERLRELDPNGRSHLLERVLRAFESSAIAPRRQFRDARQRGDMAGIRHVVHTLKSSSASIGALALSRMCAEIETAIRSDADSLACPSGSMPWTASSTAVLQAVTPMLSPLARRHDPARRALRRRSSRSGRACCSSTTTRSTCC